MNAFRVSRREPAGAGAEGEQCRVDLCCCCCCCCWRSAVGAGAGRPPSAFRSGTPGATFAHFDRRDKLPRVAAATSGPTHTVRMDRPERGGARYPIELTGSIDEPIFVSSRLRHSGPRARAPFRPQGSEVDDPAPAPDLVLDFAERPRPLRTTTKSMSASTRSRRRPQRHSMRRRISRNAGSRATRGRSARIERVSLTTRQPCRGQGVQNLPADRKSQRSIRDDTGAKEPQGSGVNGSIRRQR